MADLRGIFASDILKVVMEQIGSALGGQITLQQDFTEDLEKMKMALEPMDDLLEHAERLSTRNNATRLWLKRLTNTLYAISNMITEFETDTQPSTPKLSLKKHMAVLISCLPIAPKISMANKMKTLGHDLEVIIDQHHRFKLSAGINADYPEVTDTQEESSIMAAHIVGRTDERDKILAFLSESITEITVLAIYGIGGLGKTTLAKMVYNGSQFKDYSHVWANVSQIFDLKKIANSIISHLTNRRSYYTEMQMIHNSLSKLLADKKILIVLDDLWESNESHLDNLRAMLELGKDSKVVVVVTTRDEGIARKISTIQPHKLAPLTHDMCWTIIKQKSAFEYRGDTEQLEPIRMDVAVTDMYGTIINQKGAFEYRGGTEQLEQIGMDIAVKCGGVPLAAQSLGHMLHSLSSSEWKSVRDSDIFIEDTSLAHVLASLRLSYSDMPSGLKLCFAYCAIFPKGHKINKDDLILQWVSLGFIKATRIFSARDLGERYIEKLLGLSFLQISVSPSIAAVSGVTLLTMHGLVHDLARSVLKDEILVASEYGSIQRRGCHYALLKDCSEPLESSDIRALRFVDCAEIVLHEAAFLSSKFLRVLDLRECSIHKLPDSIGLLKQLRYLNAPRIQDSVIPSSITNLSKLIYLNLCGSSTILALPESIGDIDSLMYLDLSGCSGMKELPESFGSLTKLVHLDLSNCSLVGDVSKFLGSLKELQYLNLSHCPNIGELPKELGVLSELQYLNLSFSSYLQCCQEAEVLGNLTKLKYLNLSSESCDLRKLPEALGSFLHLKYLNLSGCQHMEELSNLFGNLKKLVHLDLSNCFEANGEPVSSI